MSGIFVGGGRAAGSGHASSSASVLKVTVMRTPERRLFRLISIITSVQHAGVQRIMCLYPDQPNVLDLLKHN